MRYAMRFGLCCLMAAGAFAQHRGGGGGRPGGGGTVAAGHIGGHGFRGSVGYRGFNRGVRFYSPWSYGAYWPSYWNSGFWDQSYNDSGYSSAYAGGYAGGSNVTVIYPPPAQPVYPVIQAAQPVIREYRQPDDYGLPAERDSHPVLFLIAFQDHSIRAAATYWMQGDTLHYLDTDHKEKQAPLSTVDEGFSEQLNRERHIPFHLP